MTSIETYYKFIEKLNQFLIDETETCRVYKSGFDFAMLENISFPLVQLAEIKLKEKLSTSEENKIFTEATYQLSFFSGPVNEYKDTISIFTPWRKILDALRDINLLLTKGLLTIVNLQEINLEDAAINGKLTPSAVLLIDAHFIGDYVISTVPVVKGTDDSIIDSIDFVRK